MDTHDIAMHIQRNDGPAVLATLIGVEGHSYRKAGAVMLFFEGGRLGSLSPGCLESDLQLRMAEVWERGVPELVEYDMLSPDDLSWGETVGCGGKIKVVLEPVKGELRTHIMAVSGRLAAGKRVVLSRESAGGGYRYILKQATGEAVPLGRGNTEKSPDFSTLFVPKPRLVIFGGGLDAGPVAELAARVGFRIAVADWREGSLQNEFPGAQRVICSPAEAAQRLGIGREDYVLICSHQLQRDRQFLEQVGPRMPRYIGIVGSRARIALLLEGLEAPAALHAPVGLPIGGEGPEEIAVSIVAEIIQIRRAGSRKLPKGVESIEDSRHLPGSRTEQTDGSVKGFAGAVAGSSARERRAQ